MTTPLVTPEVKHIPVHKRGLPGVIVDTIWVSAAVFPSLLPGVLWPVACALSEFALCPLEHTTIPTDSCGPLHTLVLLASTNTTSTTVLVLLAGTTS